MHPEPTTPEPGLREGLRVRRFSSSDELAAAAAGLLREQLEVPAGPPRLLMLSGGNTPRAVYASLAATPAPCDPRVRVTFSDERVVPRASPDNNFLQATPFLDAWGLIGDRAIAVHTELPTSQALELFQHNLARLRTAETTFPLAVLGMGPDGHTAALFSGEHLEAAAGRCAILVNRPDGLQGITVTPMVLSWFARVVVLITGEAKRPRVREWVAGSSEVIADLATRSCPAVELWVDPAAAP